MAGTSPATRSRAPLAKSWAALLAVLSLFATTLTVLSGPVSAAGGAYTLNFAAGNPADYIPAVPFPTDLTAPTGRGDGNPLIPFALFNDGATDVKVESLAPQDMALGQIVPFETKVTVSGNTTPENGVITMVMGWNTLTTNGGDFGYDARADDVGYGVIGAFIDTGDGAHVDANDDATVTGFTWSLISDEIVGVFTVSGLDDGDTVVLETWLVLDDTIPAGIGGNVQSRLIDAATGGDQSITVPNSGAITLDNGDAISTGNQTVPLLKPSDFFTADVDLSITKSDDPDPVELNGTLTYTISVTNDGPAVANSVVVYDELDPNTTFVSASDGGFLNTDSGDAIPDGAVQWDVGALAPGDTATFTVTVTVDPDAPTGTANGEDLLNTVTVTTISNDVDPSNDVATEPTDVLLGLDPPAITVVKTAGDAADGAIYQIDEPGGAVTYTVVITNTGGDATIGSVVDDPFDTAVCVDGAGDPVAGQAIGEGETITCTFEGTFTGDAGDSLTDTVTVEASNAAGSDTAADDAVVELVDVPAVPLSIVKSPIGATSLPEPGGDFDFQVVVTNDSTVDTATITDLDDTYLADLQDNGSCVDGDGNTVAPFELSPAESLTCTFTVPHGDIGNYTNSVAVTATDDDGADVGGTSNEVTVTVTNVDPTILVTKTANPTSVPETGGDVTYTVTVENTSTVDAVTLDSLLDDEFGDILASCDTTSLAVGATATCVFTETLAQNAGTTHTNVATATASDGEGGTATDNDDATVDFTNVMPDVSITKTANPTSVDEPGANVEFTIVVTNNSLEDATIDSLTDSDFDLATHCADAVGTVLGHLETYTCVFTEFVGGNAGEDHQNTATVVASDDEGNTDTESDTADVTVDDVPSAITLVKEANPTSVPETGGDVTFTFTVTNDSLVDEVTIDSLTDDTLGNLNGEGDCSVPQTIAAGGSYDCSVTVNLSGQPADGHTNVATASGTDDDGNPVTDDDDASVDFTDVPADILVTKTADPTTVDEPGGSVTYTFSVQNLSTYDAVTIDTLMDSIYGDLNGQGNCGLGAILNTFGNLGDTYTCSITVDVTGQPGDVIVNQLDVTGRDDDGSPVSGSDSADVTITDVPSSIQVTKSANPASVPETGGDVTYTVTVANTSLVDDVTINQVVDSIFGDVSASCTPALPATMAPGEAISCSFTEFISGDAGEIHTNVATATGTDDDGNQVDGSADEEVPFKDVLPDISITKTANPALVPETGGDVTFTFVVTNNSTEAATLDSLVDDVFLDLNGQGTCVTPQPLAANGGTYTCEITKSLSGNASGPDHSNVVTATASDDDGNSDTATDDETVVYDDVPPDVSITKTANPTSVPETGGDVTFTIVVTNNSLEDATIDSLTDSEFDLAAHCPDAVGTVLGSGDSYTCVFTETLVGDASGPAHVNVATVSASDDDGNTDTETDDETVGYDDVLPTIQVVKTATPTSVDETGGSVTFTIEVTNTSDEPVTIASIGDTDFDLSPECDDAVGTVLAPDATYTCSFTEQLSGDASGPAHVNTATATATDNEGNEATGSDDATVTFEDVLPDISITKTANPASVPETGGDVTFTFVVTNHSLEDATLDSLVDDVFLDLNGQGTCATGGTIAGSGGTYTCEITVNISGDFSGPDHLNTVTASASDNDGNSATAEDTETVTLTEVFPDVSIVKTANPTSVDEPGADVEFTIVVTNNSLEDATIGSLIDSDFDLATHCADAVGTVLGHLETYTCVFTEFVAGNPADGNHVNTATVVASDNDGNDDTESDDETVVINDVAPVIVVTKTADQAEVFAPGEDVTFTIRAENQSVSTDPVTIDSIVDDVYGDLSVECGLPVTIASGGAFECDITRTISGDHTNTVTVSGADDEGTAVSGSDSASVIYSNPSLTIEKSTGPADADTAPGPEILDGATVTWFYQVTNDGDVDLENLSVVDDQGVAVTCPTSTLPAGATTVCTGTGTATAGQYANLGTASASYTDADGDVANPTADDPSHYFGAVPSVAITKVFADDNVIAGGASGTFTLVASNDGNVDLDAVSITDSVDPRLVVSDVSVSNGTGDCTASAGQEVDCTADLAVGESVEITVTYSVDSSTPEADGPGGLNEDPDVSNTATVSDDYTDALGNGTTVTDEATDTVGIQVDIALDMLKTFSADVAPQGTAQSFTLDVTNTGPSDAVGVSVTDLVDGSLAVTGASVTTGSGDCSASSGQMIDCTVNIPAGETVTITVEYLTAPFLGDDGTTTGGDTFRFVFANGDVLEGSTATGEVTLNGIDVSEDVTIVNGLSRNDIVFDPDGPGGEPAIELHLSCSDPFTGGWGQSGGPVEGVNSPDFQVAFFTIGRYNNNGFIKSCGNVTLPFDVDNTANASGEDTFGTETASASDTVTVGPGITLDKLQTNGKRLTVRLTNYTGEDKMIENVSIIWPDSNGEVTKIRLDEPTVWQGTEAPPGPVVLDATDAGWNGGTLLTGEGILRFDFAKKSANSGYTIRVNFTDGTFLDISA